MTPSNSKLRRSSLYSLCNLCVLCVSVVVLLANGQPQRRREHRDGTEKRALKDVFKNDFKIGAALNRRQIFEEDARGAEIVRTHFNSITPENILKWALVHPEPNKYDFTAPDRMVEFGEKNGMFIVGHTLVWHNQTPRWVFEDEKKQPLGRDALLQRMREHIFTV